MNNLRLWLAITALTVIAPSLVSAQVPALERRTVEGFQAVQKADRTRKAIAELEGPHMGLVKGFWQSNQFNIDAPKQAEYERIAKAFKEHLKKHTTQAAIDANKLAEAYYDAKIDSSAPAKGEKRDGQYYFPGPQEKSQAIQQAEKDSQARAKAVLEVMGRKKLPNLPLSWAALPNKSVFYCEEVITIFQVVDRENALAKKKTPNGGEVFFWLADMPMDGLADGAVIKISGVFLVDGTETYNTPQGTNTVKVLRRLPIHTSEFYELRK